jgi:hypothetical protein
MCERETLLGQEHTVHQVRRRTLVTHCRQAGDCGSDRFCFATGGIVPHVNHDVRAWRLGTPPSSQWGGELVIVIRRTLVSVAVEHRTETVVVVMGLCHVIMFMEREGEDCHATPRPQQ